MNALLDVKNGASIYRTGVLGVQHASEGQFWALENPIATIGYSAKYGLPATSSGYRFVVGGTIKDGMSIVTRESPGIGSNLGGAIEVVTPAHGVVINWFHMP